MHPFAEAVADHDTERVRSLLTDEVELPLLSTPRHPHWPTTHPLQLEITATERHPCRSAPLTLRRGTQCP
jgi:hypothetical protein